MMGGDGTLKIPAGIPFPFGSEDGGMMRADEVGTKVVRSACGLNVHHFQFCIPSVPKQTVVAVVEHE